MRATILPVDTGRLLIDDRLASGTDSGYVFTADGCTGTPVDSDPWVGARATGESGGRAFSTVETGVIRQGDDGEETTCLTAGQPWQRITPPAAAH